MKIWNCTDKTTQIAWHIKFRIWLGFGKLIEPESPDYGMFYGPCVWIKFLGKTYEMREHDFRCTFHY